MGLGSSFYFFFEGKTNVALFRNRYLAPGGRLLPNRCTMHLVGVADRERHDHTVGFWRDVYGYKMSCMKKPGEALSLFFYVT